MCAFRSDTFRRKLGPRLVAVVATNRLLILSCCRSDRQTDRLHLQTHRKKQRWMIVFGVLELGSGFVPQQALMEGFGLRLD